MNSEFELSLRNMLKLAGIPEKKADNIIATQKYEYVKKRSLEIIDNLRKCIASDRFDEAEGMLEHSPAGDGYGCNNDYLDFISVFNNDESKPEMADIGYIIYTLRELKNTITKKL